jgi:hypothetical protein
MRLRLMVIASFWLLSAALAGAEPGDWKLGFRSSLDFGSFAMEQDAQVSWRDAAFIGLDLVTNPKIFFTSYPGGMETNGMELSWRYNVDLETRLEAGWRWAPWRWLSLRAGLDASLLLTLVDYNLADETYGIDLDWSNVYWIVEPAAFFTVDLDYGTWFKARALQGWDARVGIRVPLRTIYYDWERWRLILSLGWEY